MARRSRKNGKLLKSSFWTVALINDDTKKETLFGVFTLHDAMIAKDSGKIICGKNERLQLRHLRLFPN
jgi:hypothetical protein